MLFRSLMNYLVISPYYPQNFQQFTVELANKGITVLGIGQEPYEQLDQPLKEALTEYFRAVSYTHLVKFASQNQVVSESSQFQ